MPYGLGGFAQGLLGGAQAVMSIYGAYQGIQVTKDDMATEKAYKAANDPNGDGSQGSSSDQNGFAGKGSTVGAAPDADASGGDTSGSGSLGTVNYPSSGSNSGTGSGTGSGGDAPTPKRLADPTKITVPPPSAPAAPSSGGMGVGAPGDKTPFSDEKAPPTSAKPVTPTSGSGVAGAPQVATPAVRTNTPAPTPAATAASTGPAPNPNAKGTTPANQPGAVAPAPGMGAGPAKSAIGANTYGMQAGANQNQQQVDQANTAGPGAVSQDGPTQTVQQTAPPPGQAAPMGALPSGSNQYQAPVTQQVPNSAQDAINERSPTALQVTSGPQTTSNGPGPIPNAAPLNMNAGENAGVKPGDTGGPMPGLTAVGARAPGDTSPPSAGQGWGSKLMGILNPSAAAAEPKGGPNMGGGQQTPSGNQPGSPAAGMDLTSKAIPSAADAPTDKTPLAKAATAQAGSPAAISSQTQTQTPNPAAGPAGVNIPAAVAPVVAGQTGPTVQSEPTPKVIKPTIDPRPLDALQQQAPDAYNLVMKISKQEDVDPARLAAHWYLESGLHDSSPDSKTGAMGVMQVEPATAKYVDPKGTLDPRTLEGSLTLGARYINLCDRQFGTNSLSSCAAYTGGPKTVHDIATNPDDAEAKYPKTLDYTRRLLNLDHDPDAHAFSPGDPTRSKLDTSVDAVSPSQGNWTGTAGNNAPGLHAAMAQGPDQFVKYMVATSPQGMNMSDSWRHAETAMIGNAILHHDYGAVGQIREQVLQMSMQGANQHIQQAYQMFQGGNMQGAAQSLAAAHAFFPDGSVGRYGTDASGHLFAQQMDENDPSKALGQPFQITPEGIQGMMIQTADPNKYLETVQGMQAHVANMRLANAHADYYEAMPAEKAEAAKEAAQYHEDQVQGRLTTATEGDKNRLEMAREANATRVQVQAMRDAEVKAGKQGDSDKFARATENDAVQYFSPGSRMDQFAPTNTNPVTGQPYQGDMTEQRGTAARIFTGLRTGAQPGEMPAPFAAQLAGGVALGRYKIGKDGNGRYQIVDGKTGHGYAYIPPELGAQLYSQFHAQALGTNTPPPGGGSNVGAGAARAPNMMGSPNSSALPVQNAPSTSTVQ